MRINTFIRAGKGIKGDVRVTEFTSLDGERTHVITEPINTTLDNSEIPCMEAGTKHGITIPSHLL